MQDLDDEGAHTEGGRMTEKGDPDKKPNSLDLHLVNMELYCCAIALHARLSEGGLEAAQAFLETGLLQRFDELQELCRRVTNMLADQQLGGQGFAARLRRLAEGEPINDWSTGHGKKGQLPRAAD
jgi:hypothetical protein